MKMNVYTVTGAVISLVVSIGALSVAKSSDLVPADKAHQHYRCDAMVELNRMTDADQIVCDELKSAGFDLSEWEADNRDQSIKLREEVFTEFF
jgi:hypothetical protein